MTKDKQVGGSHYKSLAIEPSEYAMKNGLGFAEGNVVKYVTRYKDKGGLEDLHKAKHYLEMLIESMEEEKIWMTVETENSVSYTFLFGKSGTFDIIAHIEVTPSQLLQIFQQSGLDFHQD